MKPGIDFTYNDVTSVTIKLPSSQNEWLCVCFKDEAGLDHEVTLWPRSLGELTVSFEVGLGPEIAYNPEIFSKPESPELKGPDARRPDQPEDPLD